MTAVRIEGWAGSPDGLAARREAVWWERAERQRLLDVIADLPDPAAFAYEIPLAAAEALAAAVFSRAEYRAASPGHLAALRPLGLADYGSDLLTNFGIAVRREILADGK